MNVLRLGPTICRVAAVVFVGLGGIPLANLLAGAPYIPWWSAAVQEWLTVGTAILLVACLLALLGGERLDRWGVRARALVLAPSPGAFAWLVAGAAVVLTLLFAQYCFAREPFSQDEMAQRFHAHLLLHGRLFARSEPHPEFFSATGVLDSGGRFTSQYPIGGPALLAAGMALHAVWLVNPVLTGVTVRNVYRFAAAAYGEALARGATLLLLLSPFVLIMGASEMNHVGALAFATLALAALPAWATAQTAQTARRAAVWIGVGVGGVAMIRPLDAVVLSVVIGAFQLTVVRRQRQLWSSVGVQLAAGVIPIAALLFANARTTGHPFLFAYDVLYGPNERLGFHLDPFGQPHTPVHGLLLASANLMRLDRYLFEWPLPGLLPVVVTLGLVESPTRWDVVLLGTFGLLLVAYALYWFDGFFAGPRFMYSGVPSLVLLAAQAPVLAARRLRGAGRRAVWLIMPLCVVWAWSVPTGTSSVQLRAYFYHAGRTKLKISLAQQLRSAHLPRALVFVHEGWRARLDARLKALGLTPGESEHLLRSSDACQVQEALMREEPLGDTAGRVQRLWAATRPPAPLHAVSGVAAEESVLLAEGRALTPACVQEIAADTVGNAPFPPFLELEGLDATGALGGAIVFARDMGDRNALLADRFPDRIWYRYRSPRYMGDTAAAFVPYQSSSQAH